MLFVLPLSLRNTPRLLFKQQQLATLASAEQLETADVWQAAAGVLLLDPDLRTPINKEKAPAVRLLHRQGLVAV